ncbi:hypothetical protein [Kitasatospora purpeofusca]|uniref:hypothetical protein n=1 Tax=Kitasatospora purpeofusca TaxID=67352 RepID=UPI003658D421
MQPTRTPASMALAITTIRSAVAATDPASIPLPHRAPEPLYRVLPAELLAALTVLRDGVYCPGVALDDTDVTTDGRSITLTAWSVRELSNWYDAHRPRCGSAGVRGRDGGGLEWTLALGEVIPGVRLYVWTESGEGEVLPDTALVRALCPEQARLRRLREREAANAIRMGWVA